MQIIDDMGAGGRLGAALGTGLQQLAQSKLNSLTQQHAEQKYNMQKSALEKHGIPSALGDLILSNPKIAQEIIPGLVAGGAFDIGQLPQEANIPQSAPVNQASAVQQLLSNAQQAPQQKISPLDMLNLLNSSGAGGIQIPQTMPKEISPQTQSLSPEQQTAQGIEKTANVEQRRKPTLSETLRSGRAMKGSDQQLAREKFELQKKESEQKQIDNQNKSYFSSVYKQLPKYKDTFDITNEMLQLLDTGKVSSGISGGIQETSLGKFARNEETTRFAELADKLAKEELSGTGPLTQAKLRFAQGLKPALWKTSAAQRRGAKAWNDAAKYALKENDIINELIAANNGNQPKNLERLVTKILKSWDKIKDEKYDEGTIINSNDIDWIRKDNEWQLVP